MKKSEELLKFIDHSPSAYHAADEILQQLKKVGVTLLDEKEDWTPYFHKIKNKGGSFAILRGATIICFRLPKKYTTNNGNKLPSMRLWAAHTDSPCLKIKNKKLETNNCDISISTEPYGGIVSHSFMDRELSIAGRVAIEKNNEIEMKLVDLKNPLAIIPSLAIHLQEKDQCLNKEYHLRPLLSINQQKHKTLEEILSEAMNCPANKILSYDLFLYPHQKAAFVGLEQEFIAARSLDNLAMTHAGVCGFLDALKKNDAAPDGQIDSLALFNHEEIGSLSAEGACSFLLERILRRIGNFFFHKNDSLERILANSFIFSADAAHAFHPNYTSAHSEFHQPKMGKGIVLKRHAALRYATQAEGEARIIRTLRQHNIPYQTYINRSDKMSGSTIGPILNSRLGATTIDMGCGILSMHSARELMSSKDHEQICQLAKIFFTEEF